MIMATEVVRSLSAFEALRDEWDELAAPRARPLLRHDWFSCAARAFHDDGDLRVVVVRRGGRMVAAAPLVLARAGSGERLELLGCRQLFEPSGLLFADAEAAGELGRAVAHLRVPVMLGRIESGSGDLNVLGPPHVESFIALRRRTASSLAVEIGGAWEDYARGLSSHLQRSLRRNRKRASAHGLVIAETRSPEANETDAVLDEVFSVEASGWKGRRGSAMQTNKQLGRFFRDYCKLAAARGELRVSRLRFGQHVAAVDVSLVADGRVWQLKIGFQEAFAQFSPGLLLTHDVLSWAFAERYAALEFLGSAEPWEERWNPVSRNYVAVIGYPLSVRGVGRLVADAASRVAARVGSFGRPRVFSPGHGSA